MSEFRLPDVGEGLHEAELVAWHVAVGDHVVADQPLVSVETDKAVVEIPSPRSGHVAALHGAPGDVVPVGALLVEFQEGERVDSGSVVGSVDEPPDRSQSPAPMPVARVASAAVGGVGVAVRASPAVRDLARRLGVDLGAVSVSGVEGTATRADVEAAAAELVASTTSSGPSEGVEPLRGVRRAMDANMSRSHAEVVPATVVDVADIGDWPEGTDTTLRLVRAVGVACLTEPALNATYLGRDRGRRMNDHVDIGVAVDTPDGLFVPALRNVTERSVDDLRRGLDALKADVRARTVLPEHLRGQTITLSNFGAVGGRHAALVVVPPQVAIIGAGRAYDAPVALRGEVVVTTLLPLSLTFDHRVVMGGEAARFLGALVADLQSAD